MIRSMKLHVALAAALFVAPAVAQAATITFWSGDGGDAVTPGAVTPITPHGAWGDVSDNAGLALGTADWISYANTGIGGIIAPNIDDEDNNGNNFNNRTIGNETALFTRNFEIADNGSFRLWVLADDTATVTLTGPGGVMTLFTAFAGQIDPCAPGNTGPVGCTEPSIGVVNLAGLLGGNYTLSVYAFQTNADVFGVQYAGDYTPAPEPTSLLLLGTGLVAAARGARRRFSKS